MNNEFEWRNEMRKLDGSVTPTSDLWPGIAARLAVRANPQTVTRSRRVGFAFAIAASLIVAIGAGVIGQRVIRTPDPAPTIAAMTNIEAEAKPRTALDWSQPSNPKLASVAQDLDLASAKLQDALEQRPDAVFLVGLLNRTNSQRVRLMRQAPYAG
jgi:hypothetical protein